MDINFKVFQVVVGKFRMSDPKDNFVIKDVKKVFLHKNFSVGPGDFISHDVAILQLNDPVPDYSTTASPVCLPGSHHQDIDILFNSAINGLYDKEAWLSGWGISGESGKKITPPNYAWYDHDTGTWYHTPSSKEIPDKMNKYLVEVLSFGHIKDLVNVTSERENILLARPLAEATILSIDSGSPLMVQNEDGKFLIIGVASFGHYNDGSSSKPIGFMRVSSFLPWIKDTLEIQKEIP